MKLVPNERKINSLLIDYKIIVLKQSSLQNKLQYMYWQKVKFWQYTNAKSHENLFLGKVPPLSTQYNTFVKWTRKSRNNLLNWWKNDKRDDFYNLPIMYWNKTYTNMTPKWKKVEPVTLVAVVAPSSFMTC